MILDKALNLVYTYLVRTYGIENASHIKKELISISGKSDYIFYDEINDYSYVIELQKQLIDVSGDELAVEELGLQITDLREEKQQILTIAVERNDLRNRIQEMIDFLDELPAAILEYDDAITRRLVEKVTILDEKIVVTLKSGTDMEVEA